MRDAGTKRIVITGASSGIGAATAEAFAQRGARLVLAARDAEALEEIAGLCRVAGADVLTVPTDVIDPHAVADLARQARERLGGMKLAQFLTPNLSARLMSEVMSRYFETADPAPITSGNLFSPPADDGQVDGGFRRPNQRKAAALAAAMVAAGAIAGGVLLSRRRR